MKKIDPSPAIAILANLGVIAGIVFLGYELRQNTLMIRAQITQSRAELAVTEQVATYNSDYLPGIQIKVQKGEQLTDEEFLRFRTFVRGFLRNQDNAYWQFRSGLLESNTPDSIRIGISEVIGSTSMGRAVWEDQRALYTSEFVEFVDQTLARLDSSE